MCTYVTKKIAKGPLKKAWSLKNKEKTKKRKKNTKYIYKREELCVNGFEIFSEYEKIIR